MRRRIGAVPLQFTFTFTLRAFSRRRTQPCKATAGWLGAVRAGRLAQGHIHQQLGVPVASQTALPAELKPTLPTEGVYHHSTHKQILNN